MPFNLHETLTKIGPPQERSKDWQHDKKIVELHSDLFDYVASLDYDYPKDKFARKGIVICGGGKYAHLAWIAISNLRDLGYSLPIELWYKGVIELNSLQVREFEKLGSVTCHNTESISYKPRIINGQAQGSYLRAEIRWHRTSGCHSAGDTVRIPARVS